VVFRRNFRRQLRRQRPLTRWHGFSDVETIELSSATLPAGLAATMDLLTPADYQQGQVNNSLEATGPTLLRIVGTLTYNVAVTGFDAPAAPSFRVSMGLVSMDRGNTISLSSIINADDPDDLRKGDWLKTWCRTYGVQVDSSEITARAQLFNPIHPMTYEDIDVRVKRKLKEDTVFLQINAIPNVPSFSGDVTLLFECAFQGRVLLGGRF